MTNPSAHSYVTGVAATMTIVAMGLGYSITAADPTTLSTNLSEVRKGLEFSPATASFLASLCTLTLAAAVLGAGALGDLHGMNTRPAKRCGWPTVARPIRRPAVRFSTATGPGGSSPGPPKAGWPPSAR